MSWSEGAAGGIAAGVGAVLGTAVSGRMAKKEGERNRKFQKMMSDTSWQRGVADMKAAGLNPMLAYGQGGATTAPGAMARYPDYGEAISGAITSGLETRRFREELKNMRVSRRRENTQADLNEAQREVAIAAQENARNLAELHKQQGKREALELRMRKLPAGEVERMYKSGFGGFTDWWSRAIRSGLGMPWGGKK